MAQKDLVFIRSLLRKRLAALDYSRRPDGPPKLQDGEADLVDQANSDLEKDLFYYFQEREGRAAQDICRSLRRMEEGTYGICENCHGKIGLLRLKANPLATFCIECQEKSERGRKGVTLPFHR